MKKLTIYLPFAALFLLTLMFYPFIDTSGWRSSSDIHAMIEFASSLLAVTAGIMVMLHFFNTGRSFFLIISIGFVLIGAEEFVHAIFSLNRVWLEIPSTFKLAIPTTWLGGQFALLTSFFIALLVGNREIVPAKRRQIAIVYNLIGLICATLVALLIFNSSFLPDFVQLGSFTKKITELSLALLYFVAFLLYSNIYIKQQSRSPLLWSITACIFVRVLADFFIFDAHDFYDAHWDIAHLLVFLSYFPPIFGIWGETIKLQRSAKEQVIQLAKEISERKHAEEQIKTILRTTIDGYYLVDTEGRILETNDSFCSMIGYSREELLTMKVKDIEAVDTEEVIKKRIQRILETGYDRFETKHLRKDGRVIDIEASVNFLIEDQPKLFCFMRDITGRKQAEKLLLESEADLNQAQKVAQYGSWKFDVKTQMPSWSENIYCIFGLDPKDGPLDYLGHKRMIYPNDWEGFDSAVQHTSKTGEGYKLKIRITRPDGEIRWITTECDTKKNAEGKVVELFGITQDITERKRMEDELVESEERYRSLVEGSPDAIAVHNEGRFIYVNSAWAKLIGAQSPQELIGSLILNVVHPDSRSKVLDRLKDVADGKEAPLFEEKFVKFDGSVVDVEVVGIPFPYQGKFATQVVVRDITERKLAEKALLESKELLEIRVKERTAELELVNIALQTQIAERKTAENTVRWERQRFYDVLETLPVYVVLLSTDYHVTFANRFFRQRFGESAGLHCYEYLFHRDAPCEICETYTVLKTNAPHRWDWTGPDDCDYDIFDFPFTDEGGNPLILEVGIDITKRKHAEEELQNAHDKLEQRVKERTKELKRINLELQTDIIMRKQAEEEIKNMKESLEKLNQRLNEIRENERAIISREIHDQLGQSLTALKIDLSWLRGQIARDSEAGSKVDGMIAMVTATSMDVQRISSELRPSILDDLGLAAAIEWYCEEFINRTGMLIDMELDEVQTENMNKNLAIYRVLQESLTNIIRHSGAKRVQVKLSEIENNIVLLIQDDGIGISPDKIKSTKSLGIMGMFERVKQAGGTMEVLCGDGPGTKIRICIPVVETM